MEKFKLDFIGDQFHCAYIHKEEEAMKAVEIIKAAYPPDSPAVMGLDIETYAKKGFEKHGKGGLDPHLSEIATVQIYCPNEKNVFLFHVDLFAYSTSCLHSLIETRNFCAHNAQFEIIHFLAKGVVPRSIGCSMLLFRLLLHAIHPDAGTVKTNLISLAKAAFNIDIDKAEQTSSWGKKQLTDQQKLYAVKDAILTQQGAVWCLERMKKYGVLQLAKFYRLNKEAQVPIAQMVLNGIKIDTKLHNTMIAEWEKEEEEARLELKKILPEKLNLRSPKQLSDWIISELSKTEEGKAELAEWPRSEKTQNLVCDQETLGLYDQLPMVAPLLKFKKVAKLNSTYGKTLQNCISPVTGRIHASFSQCFTDTGRMSSFDPNLQNLPRGNLRQIFIPEKGKTYVFADLGQIEVRVFALHSGDSQLLHAFENGVDSYKLTASKLLKKPMDEITKEERQMAKAILLGRLFLLGAKTLQKYARNTYKVILSVAEAKQLIKELDKSYPEGRRWQMQVVEQAAISLSVCSRMGKVQRLKEDKYYNKSVNHYCQSDAAACVLKAATILDTKIREADLCYEVGMINVVHDEIGLETENRYKDWSMQALKESLEEGCKFVFPEMPLRGLVDVKCGSNWLEAKG